MLDFMTIDMRILSCYVISRAARYSSFEHPLFEQPGTQELDIAVPVPGKW